MIMENRKINILGTEYQIETHKVSEDRFLNESGLSDSSNQYAGAWAKNEEMVDWFAIQSPKIFKVYLELGLLEGCSASKTTMTAEGTTMITACGNVSDVMKVLNECIVEDKKSE